MNKKLLEQYGIKLIKTEVWGWHDANGSWMGTVLGVFDDIESVDDLLYDIELALTGNFSQIEDPDYALELATSFNITPTDVVFYTHPPGGVIPLSKMKELLLTWRAYLENNSKS